jgi:allophanate hydrolase
VPSSIRPDGLPFGVTFIGPCGSDWALAELGARFHGACDLPLGATGERLSQDDQFLPPIQSPGSTVRVAVVGAHLSGMPLNGQLLERGARLLQSTRTASCYRLFALAATHPPKPGLLRVRQDEGAAIDVEVWEMPLLAYGSFVALIPAPLGIGSLTLESGQAVQGFLCEAQALQGAQDISHFGGWRAYLASLGASSTR